MNDSKAKEETGAGETSVEFTNFELKPKKKDICIHKKATECDPGETKNAIKEEEVYVFRISFFLINLLHL